MMFINQMIKFDSFIIELLVELIDYLINLKYLIKYFAQMWMDSNEGQLNGPVECKFLLWVN